MLWVAAGKDEFALPAANARRVRLNEGADAGRLPHLMSCLGVTTSDRARYAIDLDLQGDPVADLPACVGVDAVGQAELLLVRPLGPLVAGLGPFAGVIVRGDGSLRFALDAWAIAPRARAFTAAASSSIAAGPGSSPTPRGPARPGPRGLAARRGAAHHEEACLISVCRSTSTR